MNPEEILTRDALTKPHRTVIDRSQVEQSQIRQLTMALKQQMIKKYVNLTTKKSIALFFRSPRFLLRFLLSAWGSVERNVFPEDIPPFIVCYGFASNENFQDFLKEGMMSLLIG